MVLSPLYELRYHVRTNYTPFTTPFKLDASNNPLYPRLVAYLYSYKVQQLSHRARSTLPTDFPRVRTGARWRRQKRRWVYVMLEHCVYLCSHLEDLEPPLLLDRLLAYSGSALWLSKDLGRRVGVAPFFQAFGVVCKKIS